MKTQIIGVILFLGLGTQSCVPSYTFAKSRECKYTFQKIHKLIHKDKDITGRTVYYIEKMDSLTFTTLILESKDCFTGILYEDAAKIFDKDANPAYKSYNFQICFDTLYRKINIGESYGLLMTIPTERMFVKGVINKKVRGVELMLAKEDGSKYGIMFR